ncbi:putative serine protease K12H4.7 [Thrips palmi]|uniref:Serine protease K12H4.7 n=1 Tax=Thrips palmi TaxID=161013 RepID=A0A6P8YMF1_THRPL|nr:putative serine protease K12H4.7 [Thrips palmi]
MWKVLALSVLSAAALVDGALLGPRPAALPAALRGPSVSTDTFEQKLDHFSPSDRRTWKQRYVSWVGANAADGPAFILLSGQEPIHSQMQLMNSFAAKIGDSLQGRSFHLEHRFYGESRPTGDLKLESLRYLSQDQAVADIAYFIAYLRKQALIPEQSKVVLYGGAYAGNLATWARLKYPHLVHAAVASSAPLLAKVDFPEYIDEVMKKLEQYGDKQCADVVRDVVDYVDAESKTSAGIQGLVDTFKLCKPFGDKPWDVDMLFNRIATVPASTVSSINVDPNYDIVGEVCHLLREGTTPKSKAERLAEAGGFGMSDDKLCETISYADSIAGAQKENWGEAVDQDGDQIYDRPSLYQSCTEQGVFTTLAHWKGHYPLELSLQKCQDVFGPDFDKQLLEKAVRRTNQEFGGNAPDVRRVVFVRGEIDPYNVLGVRDDLEDMEPVITIAGMAACADVHAASRQDTQAVTEARTLITQQLTKFLAMTD